MEYQEIINLLDHTTNQLSKFRRNNWVEINDESLEKYTANGNIEFKTSMIRSSLCDYSDAQIHVKATITVQNTAGQGTAVDNTNKKVIFKNCPPYTNCVSAIINTRVDDAQDIDIIMSMYNLIK